MNNDKNDFFLHSNDVNHIAKEDYGKIELSYPSSSFRRRKNLACFYTMKILFILTLCFYINVEAQCKSNKSIYGNAISVLYEKLLKDEVLEKTDTLYLILDEKANLNTEQDKISKNISFKVPFLRLGESSPIYKMNPYLIYKKNRVIIKINICQITHEKDGMKIISSGTFVLYYRIKGVSYKLIKIENRGI